MHSRRSGVYALRPDAAAIDGADLQHRTGRPNAPNAADLRTAHGEGVAAQIPAETQSQDDTHPWDKASTGPSPSQNRRRPVPRTVNGEPSVAAQGTWRRGRRAFA